MNLRKNNGIFLITIGFIAIFVIFVIYSRYQDPIMVTPDAIESFQRFANIFYIVLTASFVAISFGLLKYQKFKVLKNGRDLLSIIAISTSNPRSKKIFVITLILYGIFFSLTSGTLVYQPEVIFSYHYGATVPSIQIAPCCDEPGYSPKILVYLTEHIGLQIIPINLVLQLIVSYLVALNVALAVVAISYTKKGSGFSSIGAATGLFIACPTCVGSFLAIFVGTASGIALTIALVQLQTLLISISIPILLVTPIIIARKLRNADGSCVIKSK